MIKATDLLVECLENEGIKRIFGVPGEENADLLLSVPSRTITLTLGDLPFSWQDRF
jgi:acetolactate synthase-1/2/3 large subunit